MKQVLGAVTVLIGFAGAASAAAITMVPAESTSMILIGAGLVLGAALSRTRTKRG